MQSEGRGMEDTSELAGNLLAELLVVREDCRMRVISEREALKRISAIHWPCLAAMFSLAFVSSRHSAKAGVVSSRKIGMT